MSEGSIFFFDPAAFTAYQDCNCSRSQMIDDVQFEQGAVEGDKVRVTAVCRPNVCSVCKKPYRLMVDPRRVAMITNVGEG